MLEFAYQFLMLERVRECEDVETPGTETHKLAKMPPETQRVRREEQMEESLFSFPRVRVLVQRQHTHTHTHKWYHKQTMSRATEKAVGDSDKQTLLS